MPDVFLTSTFRNDWNRAFNLRLGDYLEGKGFSCFLPQRDSQQTGDRQSTFDDDVKGLDSCGVLLAIGAKTQTANWGFEIGYAYAMAKPIIILTDHHHAVELMPEGAASQILIVDDLDNVDAYGQNLQDALRSESLS